MNFKVGTLKISLKYDSFGRRRFRTGHKSAKYKSEVLNAAITHSVTSVRCYNGRLVYWNIKQDLFPRSGDCNFPHRPFETSEGQIVPIPFRRTAKLSRFTQSEGVFFILWSGTSLAALHERSVLRQARASSLLLLAHISHSNLKRNKRIIRNERQW